MINPDTSGPIQTYPDSQDLFRPTRIHPACQLSESVQTHQDSFRPIRTHQERPGSVQILRIHPRLSRSKRHIRSHPDTSWSIHTHQNLPMPIKIHPYPSRSTQIHPDMRIVPSGSSGNFWSILVPHTWQAQIRGVNWLLTRCFHTDRPKLGG